MRGQKRNHTKLAIPISFFLFRYFENFPQKGALQQIILLVPPIGHCLICQLLELFDVNILNILRLIGVWVYD
jgi:hypothetical protein